MDKRTGEIFEFPNEKKLNEAKKGNAYLVEVNCRVLCQYRVVKDNRVYCVGNRKQRRELKCFIKKGGKKLDG